jgi:hypothetical protein
MQRHNERLLGTKMEIPVVMSFSDGTSSCLGVVEKRTHQVLPVSEYRFLAAIILALLGIVSPTHAAAMPAPATRYVFCEFTVFQAPTTYFRFEVFR